MYDRMQPDDKCPACGGETSQDSVDVGVGVIYGPRGCVDCGWSEDPEYDMTNEDNRKPDERGGYKDQHGGYHPAGSTVALTYRLAETPPGSATRTRYGPRREGETEEDYAKRLDRGRNFMADLMGRTRRPWEYD